MRAGLVVRPGPVLSAMAAAWLTVAACSDRSPAQETSGDCTPSPDGGRCVSDVTGGASSGGAGDGSTSSCQVTGGSVACDQCIESNCCTEVSTCEADTDCANLLSCEDGCSTSTSPASCVAACENQYPTASSSLQQITACISSRCNTVCDESGIGDPCSAGYPSCLAGLTCNGLWCTKTCAHSSDCAGIGSSGTTIAGEANACITGPSGDFCAPECTSSADCDDFPGAYCLSTLSIEASTVSVCSSLPDAAAD